MTALDQDAAPRASAVPAPRTGERPASPVALVTGASGDFGRSLALALDALGCRVAVHYRSGEEAAQRTAGELRHDSVVVGGDVADWDDVVRLEQRIAESLGPVDVVVNNSAVRRDSLMAMQSPQEWASVIATNLVGTFHVSRACLPGMLKRRWGRIVNIVSPSGIVATAGQTAYSASKAGVIGMTRTLAAECGRRGVTVNALSPGFMVTQMTSGLPDSVTDGIRQKCPMGRFGTTDEIAQAVGFFLDAGYMTGQVVSVDGGVSIT
ncbi:SDR family oxidoreductase [Paenibacillus sp. TRM 82003]|uniref:SDR family oxidoreductase n=1 Tax=Kineococcus sp. TRM81007 TaxID=2925831 RepID=UPI001F56C5F0|nr:SDR family oxidoreductase [Kineococcus sp. TRM81007]MCI2237330.1 SDR family oxidoreductase [Kineococcus sp. TRM81007]MCI3926563.1 SDR family oxidoreductase [Paenibacillus sp. TRM 82003]